MITRCTFLDWMETLDQELIRDQHSVDDFYWHMLNSYDQRMLESLEYFADRPDYLQQEMVSHLVELETLEHRFLGKEEYEKCAAVRDLRAELAKRYKEWKV